MVWKEIAKNKAPCPPKRPEKNTCGFSGKAITLTTNHFPVTVANKNIKLYHYDVEIKDHRGEMGLPKKKKMRIFQKMKESFPLVFGKAPLGYDSMKNAYSTVLIPQLKKEQTYSVAMDPEEGRRNQSKYTVKMIKVNQALLMDLFKAMDYKAPPSEAASTVVQMIEVMFRHYRSLKYSQISGRSFFGLNQEFGYNNDIGGGKEGVVGFFGSLRPAVWKDGSILLNLDMTHTAFYKEQMVIEFVKENFDMQDKDFFNTQDDFMSRKITKSLSNLRIRVTHALRTYKFLKITREGADRLTFDLTSPEGGKTSKISVKDYMLKQYKVKLQYPRLNCLHVGNPEKNIYIPMELCRIEKGQRVLKKLNDREVATFIRSTAVPPAQRLKQIMNAAKANKFNEDEMLKAMTFTIADMPLQTEGRVLPPPSLTMNPKERDTIPREGVWNTKEFHLSGTLGGDWFVLNFDQRTDNQVIKKFVGIMVNMGKEMKMNIDFPYSMSVARSNPSSELSALKSKYPNLKLVMCVLPFKGAYGAIKIAGDKELGLMTQCVKGANVFKAQYQTIGNILLKVNAKTGGINNTVTSGSDNRFPKAKTVFLKFKDPVIIMGADVNHPPAGGEGNTPSVAAVVGSIDFTGTCYAVERRMQEKRVEIIQDLTAITKNLLKAFREKTGKVPARIIMYRDGVSESQFREVLGFEMIAMRKACTELKPEYKPGITFICVQKRHHTRLFCHESAGIGKSKNIPPGTIVDKDITHPTETDFFLCSHQGIQGTSKPTHYHLLWDDNDIPIDELQLLTYFLCHVYSRCSRSVSIPTPVYYAHLAAFRAKVYLAELEGSDSGSVMSGKSEGPSLQEMRQLVQVTNDDVMAKRLYYI